MNLSVTHAWIKDNFKSVFRINYNKKLINFMLCITKYYTQPKEKTQSRIVCGKEK